ncbi:hypothetical protein ACHAW5_011042 [Stephanodiscus triporus]|uniref:C3H1-type domain-containing protein n=1 Tax=Stephanodiscus triporus TaxID=2934178 RepID=A0ABD3P7X9_9STRA
MVQSTSPDSVAMMHFDVEHLNRRNNYEPSQTFYSAAGNVGNRSLSNNGRHHFKNTHSSPESIKNYKTEMCRNIRNDGCCQWGDTCHYAHSEQERRPRCMVELMKDDQLTRPCSIMVETGFCPYNHRCKFLHDPSIIADSNDPNVVVFDHCTKAKKNSYDHPDRLYHHRQASCRQTNPLVAQNIWEQRPFRLPDSVNYHVEFNDTYNLVCNSNLDSKVFDFDLTKTPCMLKGRIHQDIQKELQKLCIVLRMHDAGGNKKHLDFTYEPKNCEF